VPVPVVLQKENVKTLPHEIFDRVDKLAAPRLVEYWEQDPCYQPDYKSMADMAPGAPMAEGAKMEDAAGRYGVKIEAKFTVGEYDIVILSAQDSMGLDTFLRSQNYKIPAGAEPYLRPYVVGGSKFFVAKVDIKKVRVENGHTMLSPLRFHYDSDTFTLPVRLGLINSSGTQDLIVHTLGKGRYEVANYDNVTIPTNIVLSEAAKGQFGAFYAALFDKVLAQRPKAVVTEYSWDASSCDPCPEPPLEPSELVTLGADVLPSARKTGSPDEEDGYAPPQSFTLTRMHVRYGKDTLGEDLVFREAPPIVGGRGIPDEHGNLSREVGQEGYNNFQGRYVILHPWTGPISCANPHRGEWGGPPSGGNGLQVATDTAFVARGGVDLGNMLASPAPELGVEASQIKTPLNMNAPQSGGCASCTVGDSGGRGLFSALVATGSLLFALMTRRRRRGA